VNHVREILVLPPAIHTALLDLCRADYPNEACGLLGGVAFEARTIHPLPNKATRPSSRYVAEEHALIRALRAIREAGDEVVAIYHSHPKSPPTPSATDLRENYWGGTPRVIVSLAGAEPEIRAWWLGPNAYHGIPWRVRYPGG
jgi:proteasome lid subunit RPN8/RPN11